MNGFMTPGSFKSSIYECIFNSNNIYSNTNIKTWYNGIIDVGDSYHLTMLYTHITITISNINEYIYCQGFENIGQAGYGGVLTPHKITGLSLNSTIVNSSSTKILKYKITDINNISLDLANTEHPGWYIFTFLI